MLSFIRSLYKNTIGILKFGFRYPPMLALTSLVILVVWGRLLTGFDGPHVLWDENPWSGMTAGFAASAVIGLFLHFYFILHIWNDPEILNSTSPAFRLWVLLLFLSIIVTETTYGGFTPGCHADRVWFPLGAIIAGASVCLTRRFLHPLKSNLEVPPKHNQRKWYWAASEIWRMPCGKIFAGSMIGVFSTLLDDLP